MSESTKVPSAQAIASAVESGDRDTLRQLFTATLIAASPIIFDYLFPAPREPEPDPYADWEEPVPKNFEYSVQRVERGPVEPPNQENGWHQVQILLSPTGGATVLWRRERARVSPAAERTA